MNSVPLSERNEVFYIDRMHTYVLSFLSSNRILSILSLRALDLSIRGVLKNPAPDATRLAYSNCHQKVRNENAIEPLHKSSLSTEINAPRKGARQNLVPQARRVEMRNASANSHNTRWSLLEVGSLRRFRLLLHGSPTWTRYPTCLWRSWKSLPR